MTRGLSAGLARRLRLCSHREARDRIRGAERGVLAISQRDERRRRGAPAQRLRPTLSARDGVRLSRHLPRGWRAACPLPGPARAGGACARREAVPTHWRAASSRAAAGAGAPPSSASPTSRWAERARDARAPAAVAVSRSDERARAAASTDVTPTSALRHPQPRAAAAAHARRSTPRRAPRRVTDRLRGARPRCRSTFALGPTSTEGQVGSS